MGAGGVMLSEAMSRMVQGEAKHLRRQESDF